MKLVDNGEVTRASTFVPGPGGYLIAVVISWCVFAVGLLVPGISDYGLPDGIGVLVIYGPMIVIACATYGLPVAVVGVLLVHFGCRNVRATAAHVAAAGIVGAVLGGLWFHLTMPGAVDGDGAGWSDNALWIATLTGISAATGRLAANRWVRGR